MAELGDSTEDKTEEASQHRRDELHREGQVFQSRELNAALLLFLLMLVLYFSSSWMLKHIGSVFETILSDSSQAMAEEWSPKKIQNIFQYVFKAFAYIFMPVGISAVVIGIVSSISQTGFVWTTKFLDFDLTRLDPLQGVKKLWSQESLFELLKAILKFAIVGTILFSFTKSWLFQSSSLWDLEPGQTSVVLGGHIFKILMIVSLSMLILSVGDYAFQKFRYERSIRMSKQELREERKQVEGDPQIRARIRAVQRQIATRKMTAAVKKADVVVTNPTHIAVALMYDREKMGAPRVVAKGADFMAEKIKKIARESGVPCVENVPLARALYKAIKIGHFVSRDLYNAVAEVFAYVYRLKGRFKG